MNSLNEVVGSCVRNFATVGAMVALLVVPRPVVAEKMPYDVIQNIPVPAGVRLGGDEQFDYMGLKDLPGPSGVQLGGIGVGCFSIAPDGRFRRVNISNVHDHGDIRDATGSFLAIWERGDGGQPVARRLVRDGGKVLGMTGYAHTTYKGLFPIAEIEYADDGSLKDDTQVRVRAWSGLTPHNIKDSSLPMAWIEVTVRNTAAIAKDVSVAFSWQDILGRNLYDITAPLDSFINNGFETVAMKFKPIPRVQTFAESFGCGGMRGVRQYCDPIVPKKATCQNYVNELAILAEAGDNVQMTFLPAYDLDDGSRWDEFIRSGQFSTNSPATSLFRPGGPERASAVALKQSLAAGESKTFRFLVAWHLPELRIDYKNAHPNSYFGAADYGRYFHNYFPGFTDLIAYGCLERDRILAETQSWQTPILESTYPDWLKFKILNSSVAIYNNSILNKAGAFALLEGAMGGLAGTMDVRALAFEFYQKFCPELDRSEMDLFTATQEPSGKVLHFDGQYYVGLADKDGKTPVPGNAYVCNTGGWLTQLARDYQQTGDLAYIAPKQEGIRRALGYLRSLCRGILHVPQGTIMFDDTEHPPACSYNATMYIAYLQAGEILATALGDKDLADECRGLIEQVRADIYKYLWNGRMLAYGCDSDGTNRRDDMVFVAQLGGQFMSRSHMFGDALPMEMVRAAAFGQFKSTLWHFRNQDYFAARVWNAEKNQPDKNVGGQDAICWTFYEDVFRAFPSFQAGYVEDALNVLRHTQLAHLRNGYNWTQNLWNIGELSRMDVPLAWWMTDLMASAGLNVPDQTLYLAPVIRPGETRVRLPVYFPDFWAMVDCDTQAKTVSFRVTKVFGQKSISIRKVVARPVGVSADKGQAISLPAVFKVAQGAVLDLSPYWPQLTASVQYPESLPHADQADYITVAAPLITASPGIVVKGLSIADHVTVELTCADPDGKLFYTLDGRDPCESAVAYDGPLTLKQSCTLKVRAFRKDTGWSPPRVKKIEANAKRFGVNCGGGAGEGLNADQAYVPGGWGYVGGNEAGPAGVMQPGCAYPLSLATCRYGNFEYKFDLPNGRYAVRLHFAENWGAVEGGRAFNVQIQDRPVLEKLDVAAEAGGASRALTKTIDKVEVQDGTLRIRLITLANSAMVGGIEVVPYD